MSSETLRNKMLEAERGSVFVLSLEDKVVTEFAAFVLADVFELVFVSVDEG